jgi:uncharacterized membrane protein YeaQ/YmgE (transglycosylase-associated protein family)
MFSIIGWIVCGWIAGSIAEWLLPPSGQPKGWQTIATGIAGSVVGGLVYGMLHGRQYSPAGIVYSVIGAVICLAAYRWYQQQEA